MASLRIVAATLMLTAGTPSAAETVADWHLYSTEASLHFGVPVRWIERVMRAESDGRTTADGHPIRSRAGAIGLMQLMPATWRSMRLALGLGTDPDNPRDNILAGTFYLRLLYERFGYPGLFAAYDAGPHSVRCPSRHRHRVAGGDDRLPPIGRRTSGCGDATGITGTPNPVRRPALGKIGIGRERRCAISIDALRGVSRCRLKVHRARCAAGNLPRQVQRDAALGERNDGHGRAREHGAVHRNGAGRDY